MKRKFLLVMLALTATLACAFGFAACFDSSEFDTESGLYFRISANGNSYIVVNCSKDITEIVVPSEHNNLPVTSIERSAFQNRKSLKSVTVSDGVKSIISSAFRDCSSLTSITFEGTKAQWKDIEKGISWNDNTGNYTVHCTDGDLSKNES